MNIYVTKNQQKQGPYTPAEVRARIASGHFAESDAASHDGLVDWIPLSQLLASLPAGADGTPPTPQRSSGLAKASFIIAMVGIGAWLILVVLAVVAVSSGPPDTGALMIGLFMFAGMAANLAGAILGIIALKEAISNRWMAVTGVIANGVELVGVLLLMILGLAQE